MVSPLFVELFGGVLLLTLLWVLPIYFTRRKEKEVERERLDKKTYKRALKDFKNNPKDVGAFEAVLFLGHNYYSHKYPDEANYPFLELALNDPAIPTPKEVRDELIEKDIKKITRKKAA